MTNRNSDMIGQNNKPSNQKRNLWIDISCVSKHHVDQFMITRLNQVHPNAIETTLDSTTNTWISGCLLNPAESKLPLQVPSHVKNGFVLK
jgi:hypothetical protein